MRDAQCHRHVVQCDVLLGGARQPSGVFACASWTHVTGLCGSAHPLALTRRVVRGARGTQVFALGHGARGTGRGVPRVGSTRVTQTQGALGPYSSCCE